MGELWKSCRRVLPILLLILMAFLTFILLALRTLDAKYDGISAGLTVEETNRIMGSLFHARMIHWNDIPEAYTEHYVARAGAVVRDYRMFGIRESNIVVIYDEDGLSYLKIPCYE